MIVILQKNNCTVNSCNILQSFMTLKHSDQRKFSYASRVVNKANILRVVGKEEKKRGGRGGRSLSNRWDFAGVP